MTGLVWCSLALAALTGASCAPAVIKGTQTAGTGLGQESGPGSSPEIQPTPRLSRDDFNRIASALDRPLFWTKDVENPSTLDAEELAVLGVGTDLAAFVSDGKFTPNFTRIYRSMVQWRRREAVARELSSTRPTLVQTDLTMAPEHEKALVRHLTRAARIIEDLYALQRGALQLQSCLVPGDNPSHALVRRNQGPWCEGPQSGADPFCNACPGFPPRVSGLYPPQLARNPDLCQKLSTREDSDKLLDPFVVVRGSGEKLRPVPYHQEWAGRMRQVAQALRAAAAVLPSGKEQAFRAYLLAAATSFETNDWEPADEAWVSMNAENSKWYLRIAPDEVYSDPCNRKAAFQAAFARVDPESLHWKKTLTPLRDDMEKDLAGLIGPPYQAREVNFHLPDFIEIILNAGDARLPRGAFVGQSLPNWGRVAREGRRRTLVVSNMYTDPDSVAVNQAVAASLFAPESLAFVPGDEPVAQLGIILHEATHNFGPHSDYQIDERDPKAVFGGNTATILEELKAQTGALYLPAFLHERGVLNAEQVKKAGTNAILWCLRMIANGMFTPSKQPKAYSQVSAIQIAALVRGGALTWEADLPAANAQDRGRFTIHHEKVAPIAKELMKRVGGVLARAAVEEARKWIAEDVTGPGFELVHSREVSDRVLRHPKASFTYGISF